MGTLTQSTATLQGLINNIPNLAPLVSPTLSNPTFTGTVTGVTSSTVGLGNVNNTSDVNKPVSTATAAAIAVETSRATAAEALLAPITNASLLGNPTSTTQVPTDVSTKIATTAFVDSTNKDITTITFNRTDNTAVSPATPVLITINAVPSSGLTVTKNAAGQILSLPCANLNANASIVYDRATAGTTNTVDATKTMTQTKTYNVGGTTSTKTRTITRNNLNEILTISAWA